MPVILVNPIIVYPPCIKAGKQQDCFNCLIRNNGGCNSPRALCIKPYRNHKKGCPNYGKRADCPPGVPMFDKVFDIKRPVYAIFCMYDLGGHIEKMKARHPNWTETQLLNVLYWQKAAKKQLKELIMEFCKDYRQEGYYVTTSPEAMGVDVTKTLKEVGIDLEWPARKTVRKVAFAGIKKGNEFMEILL